MEFYRTHHSVASNTSTSVEHIKTIKLSLKLLFAFITASVHGSSHILFTKEKKNNEKTD